MGRVKAWAESMGWFDTPELSAEDQYRIHIDHICSTTGLIQHGMEFIDPESGFAVSFDEAEALAQQMDDPAWQREQHADRVTEQAGEDEHSCRDHGRLK